MAILKGAAGDFVDDEISFFVAVLLGREEKTGDIGKEGASEGGRGKLCSGRNFASAEIKCGSRSERASQGRERRGYQRRGTGLSYSMSMRCGSGGVEMSTTLG